MIKAKSYAAHYNKVGSSCWNYFVNAELNQMVSSNNPPYGTGNAEAITDIAGLLWLLSLLKQKVLP